MELLVALRNLILALLEVLAALGAAIAPWWPLIAWVAFWLLAVNWRTLYPVIASGGWIGVLLLWFTAILVWGVAAPPEDGFHRLLGLQVTNFFGKMIYVTGLFVIAAMCGVVQLSGAVDRYAVFKEQPATPGMTHH